VVAETWQDLLFCPKHLDYPERGGGVRYSDIMKRRQRLLYMGVGTSGEIHFDTRIVKSPKQIAHMSHVACEAIRRALT